MSSTEANDGAKNDNRGSVDIELVKKNAANQGIDLQHITLVYVGLNENEKARLCELGLIGTDNGNRVLGRFTSDGDALFPDKIESCLYLPAD